MYDGSTAATRDVYDNSTTALRDGYTAATEVDGVDGPTDYLSIEQSLYTTTRCGKPVELG